MSDVDRFDVRIIEQAEREMDAYYGWVIDRHSQPLNALAWIEGLERLIESLDFMPTRFPVHIDDGPRPIHRTHYHSHLLFYEVVAEDRVVRVLCLWHAHRDTEPNLQSRQAP
ncbi:MAG: type II toxin-antitoxin system RelE/ParE family toxin [Planctomycetota bacterium]